MAASRQGVRELRAVVQEPAMPHRLENGDSHFGQGYVSAGDALSPEDICEPAAAPALGRQLRKAPRHQESCSTQDPGTESRCLQPGIVGCEAPLVRLVAPEQEVAGDPRLDAVADRVREQDGADRVSVPRGVASRLVVPVGAAEAEAVPRCHGPSVQLEEPQPQPAALVRADREPPVKPLRLTERGPTLFSPPRPVQGEEDVERRGKLRRILDQPVAHLVLTFEPALLVANLLAQTRRQSGEKLVPIGCGEGERQARLAAGDPPVQKRRPALVGGQLLDVDERVRPRLRAKRDTERRGHAFSVGRHADRPETVALPVAEQSDETDRTDSIRDVRRQQPDQRTGVVAAGRDKQAPSSAELLPPRRVPLPGGEDVSGALAQRRPLVAERCEVVNRLDDEFRSALWARRTRLGNGRRVDGGIVQHQRGERADRIAPRGSPNRAQPTRKPAPQARCIVARTAGNGRASPVLPDRAPMRMLSPMSTTAYRPAASRSGAAARTGTSAPRATRVTAGGSRCDRRMLSGWRRDVFTRYWP